MRTSGSWALPLSALLLTSGGDAGAQNAPDRAPVKAPQRAICAVCGVREKAGPEPVAATLVYQGKSYYFCTETCRDEFRQDPARWITAAQAPEGREGVTRPPAAPEHEHAAPTRGGSAAPS